MCPTCANNRLRGFRFDSDPCKATLEGNVGTAINQTVSSSSAQGNQSDQDNKDIQYMTPTEKADADMVWKYSGLLAQPVNLAPPRDLSQPRTTAVRSSARLCAADHRTLCLPLRRERIQEGCGRREGAERGRRSFKEGSRAFYFPASANIPKASHDG